LISAEQLEGLKINTYNGLRTKLKKYRSWIAFCKETGDKPNDLFISGRYGNNNRQIVGKHPVVDHQTGEVFNIDIHQSLISHLYMNPDSSVKEPMFRLWKRYKKELSEQFSELYPVSYGTFKHHCRRFNMQIFVERKRHGADYYKKHILTYVVQKKLQYSHSLWAGDGSGTLNYRRFSNGAWRSYKLYAMMISDVASRKIVGYSLSAEDRHEETPAMLKEAMKMAIKTGEKHNVFEFVSDNHGAFTSKESKELLGELLNKHRTIRAGNSQANPAKTQFQLFKSSLKDIKNFVSSSWSAKNIESFANPDYINIEELPTYEQAVKQFAELVDRWNESPLRDGTTPNLSFTNRHPECELIRATSLRKLYGTHSEMTLGGKRGIISTQRTKSYHTYERFDFEVPDFSNTGAEKIDRKTGYVKNPRVKIIWDEHACDLYNMEREFILTCPRAILASPSKAEASEENKLALGHHLKRKEEQIKAVERFEQDVQMIIEGICYGTHIALKGNKETYNAGQIEAEHTRVYINTAQQNKGTRPHNQTVGYLTDEHRNKRAKEIRLWEKAFQDGSIDEETFNKRIKITMDKYKY